MDIVATAIDSIEGTGGYTDPLIFAIPVALVVIVIVIVISATKIDSQQTRIRNEDRLLDTLERIRLENMAPMESDVKIETEPKPKDGSSDKSLFMGGLTGEAGALSGSSIEATNPDGAKNATGMDAAMTAAVSVAAPDVASHEVPDTVPFDREGSTGFGDDFDELDEDEDFEAEEEDEPAKPPNAICDPDGLCFMPLPGQSVEEARYIARAKRDGTYVPGQTEAEAAALSEEAPEGAAEGSAAGAEDSGVHEVPAAEADEVLDSEPVADSETEPVEEEAPHEEVSAESAAEADEEPVTEVAPHEEAVEETIEETVASEEPAEATPEEPLDKPESKTSRLRRLKERLTGKGKFGRAILGALSRADLEESDWEDLEDELLSADFGVEATVELIDKLKTKQKVAGTKDAKLVRRMAKRMIGDFLDRHADRSLHLDVPEGVEGNTVGILMVGVNGGGKTTTVGKLARFLVANRKSVVLGAADTFRAAAGEQLETWGNRVGVPVVRSEKDKADPASVAFDAAKAARENGADVVLIDTAGRLQNKAGLMDELGKIKRVAEKQVPITEVLLVIDATTGQNALSQAKIFTEAVGVTGIVLTKLDGSAKGGVIVPLQRELGIPVKLVGLGEGPDDLAPFVPADFSDALLDA